jgi:hypothetical protein
MPTPDHPDDTPKRTVEDHATRPAGRAPTRWPLEGYEPSELRDEIVKPVLDAAQLLMEEIDFVTPRAGIPLANDAVVARTIQVIQALTLGLDTLVARVEDLERRTG